jgi:endonuclease/exonuclease/phosphatase family metal-dependent hydrolase
LGLLVFGSLILIATISDYRPDAKVIIEGSDQLADTVFPGDTLGLLIWNIGYGGLDKAMDFFYDGGTKVRTPAAQYEQNMAAIIDVLQAQDANFILLQEVDAHSKRSFRRNQIKMLSDSLPLFTPFYGKNYDVLFVPVPWYAPMGRVNSGLLSFTRWVPSVTERYRFPGEYNWPVQLFMLDRCFTVMHFPVKNGRELLVVNTHNEAYDDGHIRDAQMTFLKTFLLEEYQKGNYVVVGGDWNQCPGGFVSRFTDDTFDTLNYKEIEKDYLPPQWQWIYDKSQPTNRRLDVAYTRGKTLTTLIDFYLLSPNLKPVALKTLDLRFSHADHQPVHLKLMIP